MKMNKLKYKMTNSNEDISNDLAQATMLYCYIAMPAVFLCTDLEIYLCDI